MGKQGTRARLHFSEGVQAYLESQVKERKVMNPKYSLNDEIVKIVEGKVNHRPCIISVDLPDEGREKRLKHLRSMFEWVEIDKQAETHSPEALCAAPKGLSYDEAFILLQKRYYDVGWVYADAVSRLPQDVELAK